MTDIAIISAIYGDYDKPKPVLTQVSADVEWVLVTDNHKLVAPGWRIVYDPRPGEIKVRAAKHAKIFPWNYTSALASIWVDGSCQVKSPAFAVEAMSYADPMAQFKPDFDCLYAEARNTQSYVRYMDEPIDKMVERYQNARHPEHWGLWAGTVIARWHTPRAIAISYGWYGEIDNYCHQDQISEPYVLRSFGYRPAYFPGKIHDNEWFDLVEHVNANRLRTIQCTGGRG